MKHIGTSNLREPTSLQWRIAIQEFNEPTSHQGLQRPSDDKESNETHKTKNVHVLRFVSFVYCCNVGFAHSDVIRPRLQPSTETHKTVALLPMVSLNYIGTALKAKFHHAS